MTPQCFDTVTCREMAGDERARELETKARTDADKAMFDPPARTEGGSYWNKCQQEFAYFVYTAQYRKRTERNQRKLEKAAE